TIIDNSDELNSLFNKEENNSDIELLVSTLISTFTSVSNSFTPNLNVIKKNIYIKTNRSESFVWKFFEKYTATESIDNKEEQFEKLFCSFDDCDTEYLWKGSKSNMINHLCDFYKITKESLKDQLIKSNIKQQMIQQVPCVNTIKTIIFNSYTSATRQITDLISKISDTMSLTFDIWTSRVHDSYLGITCYWLTDSFELHKIVLDMGELDEHCASDIVESVNSTMQQIDVTNVKCAGHMLQLSVNLGLKEVEELISKYKALVFILLKKKKHKQLYGILLSILLNILLHLKPAIAQLYLTFTNHSLREVRKRAETMGSFIPSLEEFELLKELIEILSSFDEVTQFLNGSKYSILGFMTPILEELARQFRYFNGINDTAILVRDTILENLIEPKNLNVEPTEFDQYCELTEVSLEEESCPLDWWRKHKTLFPTIAILARRYLAMPASS
ncbi:8477_t:CDS:2, partial [Gigaspora margarita]